MKHTKTTQTVHKIELTADEADQLAAMLIAAIDFAHSPLAAALYEALIGAGGCPAADFCYDSSVGRFRPYKAGE